MSSFHFLLYLDDFLSKNSCENSEPSDWLKTERPLMTCHGMGTIYMHTIWIHTYVGG